MVWNRLASSNLILVGSVASATLLVPGPVNEAAGQTLEESLVSWWPMEATTVEDVVGDNEPSATDGLSFVQGRLGDGVTLNQPTSGYNGGYIEIPDTPSLRNQPFTLGSIYRLASSPHNGSPEDERMAIP